VVRFRGRKLVMFRLGRINSEGGGRGREWVGRMRERMGRMLRMLKEDNR